LNDWDGGGAPVGGCKVLLTLGKADEVRIGNSRRQNQSNRNGERSFSRDDIVFLAGKAWGTCDVRRFQYL